ncbi:competence type IV pilus major pilin ComGC [Halalkalibacter lacteus]|uniref:competence type IV pilus major pilin ComGC n=1 Tax=Halalkalibacter lacteus TaxID=3090663 RepID=UPI002FC61AE8
MKNEKGFTLIEMLVVLMIISVLLLIAVPNMMKNNDVAATKGCEATIKLLQSQVYAYNLENENPLDELGTLKQQKFVDTISCPDGTSLTLEGGIVTTVEE